MISLREGLSRLGTDERAVVASVHEHVGPGPGDVLLAVGSMVEGLGTSRSDCDLLLITDGNCSTAEMEWGWRVGRCVVNLRVINTAAVDHLIARLRDYAQRPWTSVQPSRFTDAERLLLHRLRHGHPLAPADESTRGEWYRPPADALARLKLQVARHQGRAVQVDMVGHRDNRDYASLVLAAQDLLGHAMDALLAAHHWTNPYPKWRSRLLEQLPADWADRLGLRPTGWSAGYTYWRLHRAPAEPSRRPAIAHALRCATVARAMFAWAEPQLIHQSAQPVWYDWPSLATTPPSPPLPQLQMDVDVSRHDSQIGLARLNEFRTPLSVSERDLAVLLLLDGTTTAAQAARVVPGADPAYVEALATRAVDAGLCTGPQAD